METLGRIKISSRHCLSPTRASSHETVPMPPILCDIPRQLVECFHGTSERMSNMPPGYGQPSYQLPRYQYQPNLSARSLNDLSTELLALIFEQVRTPCGYQHQGLRHEKRALRSRCPVLC